MNDSWVESFLQIPIFEGVECCQLQKFRNWLSFFNSFPKTSAIFIQVLPYHTSIHHFFVKNCILLTSLISNLHITWMHEWNEMTELWTTTSSSTLQFVELPNWSGVDSDARAQFEQVQGSVKLLLGWVKSERSRHCNCVRGVFTQPRENIFLLCIVSTLFQLHSREWWIPKGRAQGSERLAARRRRRREGLLRVHLLRRRLRRELGRHRTRGLWGQDRRAGRQTTILHRWRRLTITECRILRSRSRIFWYQWLFQMSCCPACPREWGSEYLRKPFHTEDYAAKGGNSIANLCPRMYHPMYRRNGRQNPIWKGYLYELPILGAFTLT